MEGADEQLGNSILEDAKVADKKRRAEWLMPYQFKKGQSGNPGGRPAGKSLKEYAKEMLHTMTDEERQEYLHGLPKEVIWKMSEGNPAQENKNEVEGTIVVKLVQFDEGNNNPPQPTP